MDTFKVVLSALTIVGGIVYFALVFIQRRRNRARAATHPEQTP